MLFLVLPFLFINKCHLKTLFFPTTFFLPLIFLFALTSCASKPKYITDSSDYISFGIDYHDMENMVSGSVESFLSSDFVKNLEGKKVLVISDIENLTGNLSYNDIESLSRKFARQIRNSKKFVLTNAAAGSGSKKDKMIKDSRALRNDEEYNQYTTKEKGNLLAPDYSLAGKITQRTKNIGKKVRVDYQFLLVLTDLKTGVVLWDNEEIISKIIARSKLQEFDEIESKQDNHYETYTKPKRQKKEKTYSYTREKIKEFFSFGQDGRNHILIGIDFGIGGGSVGFAPLDFSIIGNSYYKDEVKQHKISYEAINFVSPINMKVGYMRNIGNYLAFTINAIYNRTFAVLDDISSFSNEGWKTTAELYGYADLDRDNIKLSHRIERFGGELLLYYKMTDFQHGDNFADFYIYGGGGVLKDLNSNYTLTLETDRSSYYDISINAKGQKTLTFQQKIDSWYPLIRLGIFWNLVYGGVDTGFYCSWSTKEGNYLGTNCGVSVGLQARY